MPQYTQAQRNIVYDSEYSIGSDRSDDADYGSVESAGGPRASRRDRRRNDRRMPQRVSARAAANAAQRAREARRCIILGCTGSGVCKTGALFCQA